MNANDLTFGVEIETVAPESACTLHGLVVGSHCGPKQVPYLPRGWKAGDDCSIDNSNGGKRCEIVSPILKGREGLAQVLEVVRILNEKGHRVNASCGIHVHIGWNPATSSITLTRLITMVAYVEKGLYAITGTKSRERGRFTKSVQKEGTNAEQAKAKLDYDRYHALNLTNLANGRKDTVEFRVFSGSLNATKITGWIQVCLGLVEKALNSSRMPKWAPAAPKGGWAKKGQGQSECERLISFLAWTDAQARAAKTHAKGWLAAEGTSKDEIIAEFRRLAKKYDSEN